MNIDRIIDYLNSLKEKGELSCKDVFCAFDDMIASFDNAQGINALPKGDISDYASIISRVSRNFADIAVAASSQMDTGLSLSMIKNNIGKIDASIEKLDEKLGASKAMHDELCSKQKEAEKKELEYAAVLKEREELEHKIDELHRREGELIELKQRFSAETQRFLDRSDAYQAAEKELTEQKQKLEIYSADLTSKQSDYDKRKAAADKEAEELKAKATELDIKLNELDIKLSELKRNENELNEKNAELKAKTQEQTRLQGIVTTMQYTDLPALEKTIRMLEEEKRSWEGQILAKEREISEKKEHNKRLSEELFRKTAECTAEQTTADNSEKELTELNIKYQSLLTENAGKKSEINTRRNMIKSLASETESYSTQCKTALLELQEKQEQARKAKDRYEGITKEYRSKTQILERALTDLMGESNMGYVNLGDFDRKLGERIKGLRTEVDKCAVALETLMKNAEEKYGKR